MPVKGIKENFRFLIVEVIKQLEATISAIEKPRKGKIEKIIARDDYIDNLKGLVSNKTFMKVLDATDMPKAEADKLQAMNIIASNLESLADCCNSILGQLNYLSEISFFRQFDYKAYFHQIIQAVTMIEGCIRRNDVDQALKICRKEFAIDDLYEKDFKYVMDRLRSGDSPEDLVTTLFILRYMEKMGDYLLNIGEAIISSCVGEKLKIHQYMALEESKGILEADTMSFESVSETKSGCRIGRIKGRNKEKNGAKDSTSFALFKKGNYQKLIEEKECLEKWEKLAPGLPPKVFNFKKQGKNASLLLEFLEGTTFQKIVVDGDEEQIDQALLMITELLDNIWTRTREEKPVSAGFINQLTKRMDDVLFIHPRFNSGHQFISGFEIKPMIDLLAEVGEIETELSAPFSVFIHGDFNTDNVMINFATGGVNFIDLHRSCLMDYVQDVSVFMISNFRLPFHDSKIRKRLSYSALGFYRFARDFAQRNNDLTFEARLTIGLIRSFFTSTRFVLKKAFADAMVFRARYLMERVLDHRGKPWNTFKLPEDVIIY